jgi:hypothetical protein
MKSTHGLVAIGFLSALSFVAVAPSAAAAGRSSVRHCDSSADCGGLELCLTEGNATTCGGRGVCSPRGVTLFCSQLDIQACGCDGKPYPNACYAHKAGASIDPVPFKEANIDGDTLAEQAWMDQAQMRFYLFTGNGTATNDSGTFEDRTEPPCTRATPSCKIAFQSKTGTFFTYGSLIELDYDNGDIAFFDAQLDCHHKWQLVGDGCDASSPTLTVSTILP